MTHWQKFERLYTALLIFVSANAGAVVVVFKPFTPEQLANLGRRQFLYCCTECIAIATGTLLTYVYSSKKPSSTPPSP